MSDMAEMYREQREPVPAAAAGHAFGIMGAGP
jgi:hypothetical protein